MDPADQIYTPEELESWESEAVLDDERSGENRNEGWASCFMFFDM